MQPFLHLHDAHNMIPFVEAAFGAGVIGIAKSDVVTREQVIDVLAAHPEVMQRPVVFVGNRAVIARPSEKVLELLD